MFKRTLILAAVALLTLPCLASGAVPRVAAPSANSVSTPGQRSPVIIFFDDMESGENGWTHVDNTVGALPKFHLDTYYAYDGTYSWWCGELNAAYTGGDGYGNGWDQRLVVPDTDVSGATYPVLTFAYRYDSEPGYDYSYVQVESLGIYTTIAAFDGSSAGWHDLGDYGAALMGYDNPVRARFRFVSDGAYSDADGDYDSDGGAIMLDNIRIIDVFNATVYFLDDGESGGLCTPAVGGAAGDYWHITARSCPAYSDPNCWWCGDDADTTVTPGNLNNSLLSPPISIAGATICTLRFLLHAEVPTVDNDYWSEMLTTDGGTTWYAFGNWWGDFGQCDGWSTSGINGIDVTPYLPGTTLQLMWTFHSTDNGCGPAEAGGAGIMLDDTWVEDWTDTPVEHTTWGRVKALFLQR